MAASSSPVRLLLSALFLFSLQIFFVSVRSQVPANETFFFFNGGEFGDRIIEYDASYRVIRNGSLDFYTHPFRLCFYNTTPGEYIFAIRAGIPNDESLMRWVWEANRDRRAGENSTLTLGRDGNLVLAEEDGRVIWQTNTANRGVVRMRLLPNGNLVLLDRRGRFVWQSFHYPTDTLLVGQSLNLNRPNMLVSRTSDADPSNGPYSIVLETTGFKMYINNSGIPLLYGGWVETDFAREVTFDVEPVNNAAAYSLVLVTSQVLPPPSNRRLLQVRPVRSGNTRYLNQINYNATFSFLRLGSDGNVRAYTYYDQVELLKWAETFAFFSSYFVRECALPSRCGKFGYCYRGMCVACPSPRGLLGWSESCEPPRQPPCRAGASSGAAYFRIDNVDHFLSPYLDEGFGPVDMGDCRRRCTADCTCLGFFYKEHSSRCVLAPILGTLIRVNNATSVGYIKYSR